MSRYGDGMVMVYLKNRLKLTEWVLAELWLIDNVPSSNIQIQYGGWQGSGIPKRVLFTYQEDAAMFKMFWLEIIESTLVCGSIEV